MPPCHGGDRRFESGRARQIKILTLCEYFYLLDVDRIRTANLRFGGQARREKLSLLELFTSTWKDEKSKNFQISGRNYRRA